MPKYRIALVNVSCADTPYSEPLGICYLAAVLRNAHFSVDLFDINAPEIRGSSDLVSLLSNGKYSAIGFSAVEANLSQLVRMLTEISERSPMTRLIVGGYGPSFWATEILATCPNLVVVRGEAERTLLAIVQSNIDPAEMESIPGVVYRRGIDIVDNGWPDEQKDLSMVPWPSRDLLHIATALKKPGSVLSRRGCYGACSFCSVKAFGGMHGNAEPGMRSRAVHDIADEIEYLGTLGVEYVQFSDTNFFSQDDHDRIRFLTNRFGSMRSPMRFSIKCRVNDVLCYRQALGELHKVGLEHVFIGIETGSENDLIHLGKGVTREQCEESLGILKEIGVGFSIGLILFTPYTTTKDLKQTLCLIKPYCYDVDIVSRLLVFRDTPIMKRLKRERRLLYRPFGYDFAWQGEMESLWIRWKSLREFLWRRIVLCGAADDFRQKPNVRRRIHEAFVDALLDDLSSIDTGDIRPIDHALADIKRIRISDI